jgi:glycosyltransferase involved in cell wall biosynthesis
VLADVMAGQPARAVRWMIVGDGPIRDRLLAGPQPGNVRLDYRGAQPYAALPGLYQEADVFVFPSGTDTWGLVVNEAMASGLPVLGSVNSQAVDEWVEEEQTGWRFNPENTAAMQTALRKVLATPFDQIASMGQAARAKAAAFDPAVVADRYINLLNKIHTGHTAGRKRP